MEQCKVLAVLCFLVLCTPRVQTRALPRYYNASTETDNLPSSVDWRARGVVLPPLDQKDCSCCWALATTASIESLYRIRTGKSLRLSAQLLVDCDETNGGCSPSSPRKAFRWIINNGGITTKDDYPFVARVQPCQEAKKRDHAVKITGFVRVGKTEADLMRAVAAQPVVAGAAYKNYRGGVFEGPCGGSTANHAVLVVGYGVNDKGVKYWIIKNSHGTSWGDKGFMYMRRVVEDPEGLCKIASHASYPEM